MTDPRSGASPHEEGAPEEPVVIRDKRRFDPVTGQVRSQQQGAPVTAENSPENPDTDGSHEPGGNDSEPAVEAEPAFDVDAFEAAVGDEHPDTVLARERLEDVRRVQAEYVNYKRRVDRDRETQRDLHTSAMVESLLPVLDDFHLTREHGDLEGTPFEKIADKLDATLGKYGVERFGAAGDAFDPAQHEALMNVEADLPDGATSTTVVQVMQPGYRIGERIVRPAQVAVADPK